MLLKHWAAKQGISYRTAIRWYREGRLPVPAYQHAPGYSIVGGETEPGQQVRGVHLYARVSSHDQKEDLDRQLDRLQAFAASNGWKVNSITTEVGSGLNGRRAKLQQLLRESTGDICVEHADRLARFGVPYIQAALEASGRSLHIMNETEYEHDLVQDFVDVVTSMCARIYGRRSAKNRAQRALEAVSRED